MKPFWSWASRSLSNSLNSLNLTLVASKLVQCRMVVFFKFDSRPTLGCECLIWVEKCWEYWELAVLKTSVCLPNKNVFASFPWKQVKIYWLAIFDPDQTFCTRVYLFRENLDSTWYATYVDVTNPKSKWKCLHTHIKNFIHTYCIKLRSSFVFHLMFFISLWRVGVWSSLVFISKLALICAN